MQKGFCPLPNWFLSQAYSLDFTNREFKIYLTIGKEIFQFSESRETLSKELATRYLQGITGINYSHIAKILNKFERMGLIKIQKSFTKGEGSIISIVAPIATEEKKIVANSGTNQKSKISKKDPSGILREKGYTEEDIKKVIDRINLSIQLNFIIIL